MNDAYAHYQAGDTPRLVPSAVLFLDVLGTVKSSQDEPQQYLQQAHTAFAEARAWGDSAQGASDLTVATWFSDNVAMAMPVPEDGGLEAADAISLIAMYAALHQLSLALNGMFARGAITFGAFYADADFVHGPALNEAYRLESSDAAYPRVILADVAMKALRDGRTHGDLYTRLMVGDDEWPFVDYLRYLDHVTQDRDEVPDAQRRHRDGLRNALATQTAARVREKLRWLAAYHDDHVGRSEGGDLLVGDALSWRFRFADPDLGD